MKYGIVENHKFILIDDDLGRVQNTIMFMPQHTLSEIVTFGDDEVEQAYDGYWYVKGFAPAIPDDVQLARSKETRSKDVGNITVTVDGMVFNGDEKSQERMSRKINIARANEISMDTSLDWVLADNTIAQVTLRQLAKAALLAGQKQSELWTMPYKKSKKDKVYY